MSLSEPKAVQFMDTYYVPLKMYLKELKKFTLLIPWLL